MKKISIYIGNIQKINQENGTGEKANRIPIIRRQKMERQKNEADWKRSLMASYLLLAACDTYGVDISNYMEDSKGRPYLGQKDGSSTFFFSLSHSGNYAVCGCSSECRVGIDIQRMRLISERMAKKLLCLSEYEGLPKEESARQSELLRYFTVKESYCKLLGLGLSYGLQNCLVDWENQKVVDLLGEHGTHTLAGQTVTDRQLEENIRSGYSTGYFREFAPKNGYYGVVCTDSKTALEDIACESYVI